MISYQPVHMHSVEGILKTQERKEVLSFLVSSTRKMHGGDQSAFPNLQNKAQQMGGIGLSYVVGPTRSACNERDSAEAIKKSVKIPINPISRKM